MAYRILERLDYENNEIYGKNKFSNLNERILYLSLRNDYVGFQLIYT